MKMTDDARDQAKAILALNDKLDDLQGKVTILYIIAAVLGFLAVMGLVN